MINIETGNRGPSQVEQQSITDDKKTVGQLAKEAGVTITRFVRFVVGA